LPEYSGKFARIFARICQNLPEFRQRLGNNGQRIGNSGQRFKI